MHDGVKPWRTGDLVYLEREINYWTGPIGYQACAAGIQAAQDYAAMHGMDRVVVLPAWACRYSGALKDAVAQIDPAGLVTDCDGAEIVTMPTEESLERFVNWCKQRVRWERGIILWVIRLELSSLGVRSVRIVVGWMHVTVVHADQLNRQPSERIKPATANDQCRVSKDDSSAPNGDDAQPHALPAALNGMLAFGCPNYVRIG